MSQIIFILLLLVLAFMVYKNINLLKENKKFKRYFVCTGAILNQDSDALKIIQDFIKDEPDQGIRTKARVIETIALLDKDQNTDDNLTFINFEDILFTKGQFDKRRFDYNSDTFFWSNVVLIKAYNHQNQAVIDRYKEEIEKYKSYEVFKSDIVINLFDNIDKAKREYGDKGIVFFRDLLSGNYGSYTYDKRMIGFYKYVALAMLAHLNEELSEEDVITLKSFASMKAGKVILKELGILEKYEEKDEVLEEEVETKEETEVKEEQ